MSENVQPSKGRPLRIVGAVMLCGALAFAVAGCGSSSGEPGSPDSTVAPDSTDAATTTAY